MKIFLYISEYISGMVGDRVWGCEGVDVGEYLIFVDI